MLALLGFVSGILAVLAYVPYLRDTRRGRTTPSRTSWGIFAALSLINIANQLALGATNSVWVVVGFAFSSVVIFVASIRRGVGGFAALDVACVAVSLAGLTAWLVLQTPTIWLACNLAIASAGLVPTVVKAFHDPESETLVTWLVGGVSSVLAAISVGHLRLSLLLLPVFYAAVQIFLSLIILVLRKGTDTRLGVPAEV